MAQIVGHPFLIRICVQNAVISFCRTMAMVQNYATHTHTADFIIIITKMDVVNESKDGKKKKKQEKN